MAQKATPAVADDASGGAASATGERASRHADRQRPRTHGRLRRVLGWLLLVVLVAALWPAVWGGLTGITVVSGTSMEPVYDTNDVVLTLRQSSYEVGDVISYKVPAGQDGAGGRVIHRIIAIDESGAEPMFTTRGDNNSSVDPWEFSTKDIMGKATLRVPRIGVAFNGSSGLLLGAVAGFAVLVVLWPSTSRARTSEQKPTVIR